MLKMKAKIIDAEFFKLRPIENEINEKIEKLESENTRLREALTEIKNTVESKQDTVYPFHIALDSKDGLFILETVDNA